MLQRQLMLKQLQELQKHRQFPNAPAYANTSFMPRGASTAVQGCPNGIFSLRQIPNHFLTLPPEQLVESLSQSPVASSINSYNEYSHFQGLSPDSSVTFTEDGNNQLEKPVSFTDRAFQYQIPNGNLFGQVYNESYQQTNASAQEQTCSFEQFQETNIIPSQCVATLDPLEQKILFNMDGNGWNSLGMNTEDYTNKSVCLDYLNLFPSNQNGSWSALMQSAVDESSSDNGAMQEEWSGLSFQTTELSMDNQPSNQQNDWVDNNVVSSLNGKPQAPFGAVNMSSGFSGFQFQNKQREGTRSESSLESVQQSPKIVATEWLYCNSQQEQPIKGNQLKHTIQPPSGNAFSFQGFPFSDDKAELRNQSHDQTSISPTFGPIMKSKVQQRNYNVTSAAGSVCPRNQDQQIFSTLPNDANKLTPFDLFIPHGASQSSFSLDQVGEQFSILDSVSVEFARKSSSLCPSGTRPGEPSSDWQLSSDSTNTNSQAPPWFAQNRHGKEKFDTAYISGASLTNLQGLCSREEHPEKMAHRKDLSDGIELAATHLSEETGGDKQVSSVSARDIAAFGRSLKPSNLHLNYSSSSGIKYDAGTVNPYAFGDRNLQSIKTSYSSLPHNTAEEMGTQGLCFSHTNLNVGDVSLHKSDHSQVNIIQMASSFKQYGSLRNGQMLSMHDGKQLEISEMKTSMVEDEVKLSTASTLPPDFWNMDFSATRSRKRKTATSNLLPWHMEVAESSKRLKSISMAETDWAKAVNRLIDKVDYEVNMIKDVHPLLGPKKRLALTTQLMQLVFKPAPAAILRAKATLNHDSLPYFSAKLALGDACNLNFWSRNESGLVCPTDNVMNEEAKPGETTSGKRFSTIVEAFTGRAEKLEAYLLRLDKTASFLDIIVVCKELEKFSIINCFAKFHLHGPPSATETSTSSGYISSLLKPVPRRYVVTLKPRALPEKARCLEL